MYMAWKKRVGIWLGIYGIIDMNLIVELEGLKSNLEGLELLVSSSLLLLLL